MGRPLPVIYVRGFAGATSGIDRAVDDPFYGFNAGATHMRVAGDGEPAFYQFEGPLVRLMSDEEYEVLVYGNQEAFLKASGRDTLKPSSLWIYRFYDSAADTFGRKGRPYDLLTAARELFEFVNLVRDKTAAPKVWLVAHSMGGLICRSMLQKVCPDNGVAADALVDKFFTYATPHNGIAFSIAGVNVAVPEIAPFGAEIFNRERMYAYLTPEADLTRQPKPPPPGRDGSPGWDAHVIPDSVLSRDRVFCLIGTDAGDYGLVSRAVGPKSDGLVQIDNAYVRGAHRAFVHRSHSGAYGEVNSEEGYQNLRRFLFGSFKVAVELCGLKLPGAAPGQRNDVKDVWQGEVRVSVRGLPVVINEQLTAHYCPIQLNMEEGRVQDSPDTPVPLTTIFLLDPDRDAGRRSEVGQEVSPRCRYSLQMRTIHLQERNGTFFWQHHLETAADWEDTLVVDVGPADDDASGRTRVWAAWRSQLPAVASTSAQDPIGPRPLDPAPRRANDPPEAVAFTVDVPPAGRTVLGPESALRLTAVPWT